MIEGALRPPLSDPGTDMKFSTKKALNNWYGIDAAPGDEIEVPNHLVEKARKMDFLTVKQGRKRKSLDLATTTKGKSNGS